MLASADREDLAFAKTLIEHPSLAARLAGALGRPIERGLASLPQGAGELVDTATRRSLEAAMGIAAASLDARRRDSSEWRHTLAAAAAGAAGGLFGAPALLVELPVSTTIMLRSIADIARSEGEDLRDPATRMSCLEVFALGGPQPDDDATESAYYAIRVALARALSEASRHLAAGGLAAGSAPALARLVSLVAVRFGVPVTEKLLVQGIPVVGALGGALLNTIFIDHFQDMARGHFIVRRLERRYGGDQVRRAYLVLP